MSPGASSRAIVQARNIGAPARSRHPTPGSAKIDGPGSRSRHPPQLVLVLRRQHLAPIASTRSRRPQSSRLRPARPTHARRNLPHGWWQMNRCPWWRRMDRWTRWQSNRRLLRPQPCRLRALRSSGQWRLRLPCAIAPLHCQRQRRPRRARWSRRRPRQSRCPLCPLCPRTPSHPARITTCRLRCHWHHRPGEGRRLERGAESEAPGLYPRWFLGTPELVSLGATWQMRRRWNETRRRSP